MAPFCWVYPIPGQRRREHESFRLPGSPGSGPQTPPAVFTAGSPSAESFGTRSPAKEDQRGVLAGLSVPLLPEGRHRRATEDSGVEVGERCTYGKISGIGLHSRWLYPRCLYLLPGGIMPLVFVHGVANRRTPDYERGVAARNALFRRYLYPAFGWDDRVDPFTAYWGGDAAEFRWHHASLPEEDVEAFGSAESVEDVLLAQVSGGRDVDTNAPLSSLARHSVEGAVDLLWASTAQEVGETEVAQALAALARLASDRMAELESDPALTQAVDDDEWITALAGRLEEAEPGSADEIDEVEGFGGSVVWDRLSEAVIRVQSAAGRLSGGAAAKLLRADIHRQAALFLGDVFTYLDRRGDRDHPGPIIDEVVQTLVSA